MTKLFNETEARVAALISEHLTGDPAKVTREATFDSLGADSLDMVELTMALEDEFHVEITDDEAHKVKTVEDAFVLIQGKLNG